MADERNPLETREDVAKELRAIARNKRLNAADRLRALKDLRALYGLDTKTEDASWRKMPADEFNEHARTLLTEILGDFVDIEWVEEGAAAG